MGNLIGPTKAEFRLFLCDDHKLKRIENCTSVDRRSIDLQYQSECSYPHCEQVGKWWSVQSVSYPVKWE